MSPPCWREQERAVDTLHMPVLRYIFFWASRPKMPSVRGARCNRLDPSQRAVLTDPDHFGRDCHLYLCLYKGEITYAADTSEVSLAGVTDAYVDARLRVFGERVQDVVRASIDAYAK